MKKQPKIQVYTPIVALVVVIVCAVSQLTASSHAEHAVSKQTSPPPADAAVYFGLKHAVGQKFGNVFAKERPTFRIPDMGLLAGRPKPTSGL